MSYAVPTFEGHGACPSIALRTNGSIVRDDHLCAVFPRGARKNRTTIKERTVYAFVSNLSADKSCRAWYSTYGLSELCLPPEHMRALLRSSQRCAFLSVR